MFNKLKKLRHAMQMAKVERNRKAFGALSEQAQNTKFILKEPYIQYLFNGKEVLHPIGTELIPGAIGWFTLKGPNGNWYSGSDVGLYGVRQSEVVVSPNIDDVNIYKTRVSDWI